MDKETLAAQHPHLLQQIEDEARAQAQADAECAAEKAKTQARDEIVALMRAALGEDAAATMSTLLAAGVTAPQMEALASVYGKAIGAPNCRQRPATQSLASSETTAVLSALYSATPGPLNDGASARPDDARATIERMGAMGVNK